MKRSLAMLTILVAGCFAAPEYAERPLSAADSELFYKSRHVRLQDGVTTKQEIIAYMGAARGTSEDGKVLMYFWNEVPQGGGLFSGGSGEDYRYAKYLLLEFDDRGVLVEHDTRDNKDGKDPFDVPLMKRHRKAD